MYLKIPGREERKGKYKSESDESHLSSCTTCTSNSALTDTDQKVDEMYKEVDKLQGCDKNPDTSQEVFENLDSSRESEEKDEN